jgi:HD-like signal output (HDOD) protein
MENMQDFVKDVGVLPVLPELANRIIQLCDKPNVSLREVAELIQKDPGVTARVLKVVNSSYYALRREVSSIHQAITLLGLHQVRNLVITLLVVNRFEDRPDNLISMNEFWNHSLGVALVCQILAKRLAYDGGGDLYLTGLLHDIGKIIIQQHPGTHLQRIKAHVETHGCDLYSAEKAILGFSHAEIGGWVARAWKLPKRMELGITFHHDCEGSPEPLFSAFLQLADLITKARLFAVFGDQNLNIVFDHQPCWQIIFQHAAIDETMDFERFLFEMDDEMERARQIVQDARGFSS